MTMCGLNVTHQALATEEVLDELRALGTPLADTVVPSCSPSSETATATSGASRAAFHDPVALARVIDPALVHCVEAHVAVELHGSHTRGATVCDRFGVRGLEPNAKVAVELDVPAFWDLVIAAVDRLGRGAGTAGSARAASVTPWHVIALVGP